MKKIFGLLLGLVIMALGVSSTLAFTQEQQEAYQWAYKYWLTTQPTIESARMNSPLTRQAFAKMVVNYLENVVWVKQSVSNPCYFPDESKITSNLIPYTKKTCSYKIMWSDWKKFSPTQPVDRAQLWTVFSRILWGDKHNSTGKWYYIYHVNALEDAGIMNNIKNVLWTTAKRWDVMIMFKRMYEKFGSNVYLNGWRNDSYVNPQQPIIIERIDNYEDSDNEYISSVYSNSNVVYTWKDWTKYYYDDKFLNMLKNTAEKKWESDLADYLWIEAEYFKNGLEQITNLDDDELYKSMWIDTDNIDPDSMTKQEKQELIKKFKSAFGKIIDENKDRNDKLIKDLEKVTKNIGKDKFWLKAKYKKTKTFMEASNEFLDVYSKTMLDLMEIALMKEDDDEDSEAWLAQAFWLIWIALAYQWTAQEYQTYVEEWAIDTIEILGLELGTSNTNNTINNVNYSGGTLVCTLNKSDSDWINIKGIYTVIYSGKYVNLIDTVETVNSDSEEWIEYYKSMLEEAYEPYKNLKYYDYNIETTKNTLTSKVIINYEKIDINEFLEINPNITYIENGKVSLGKIRSYYELIGATCK